MRTHRDSPGQPEPTPPSEPDRIHPHTILVVDDDPGIRTLVAEHLQKSGYAPVTACDGPTMFAALDAHPVALIILDLNLPGEDGLSLCRESRRRQNILVIM